MNIIAVNKNLAVKIDTEVNFGTRKVKNQKRVSREALQKFPNLSELKLTLNYESKNEFDKNLNERWNSLVETSKPVTHVQDTPCFLSGYSVKDEFMILKMPSEESLEIYFEAIFDNNIDFVIILNKIDRSFLPARSRFIKFGHYEINCLDEKKREGNEVKTLAITNLTTNVTKKFYNFEFDWPNDKPMCRYKLARFLAMIIKNEKGKDSTKKLVSCLNGRTRSGTFICLYDAFKQILTHQTLDLDLIIQRLRQQNAHIVESFIEYENIYHLLLEDFDLVF